MVRHQVEYEADLLTPCKGWPSVRVEALLVEKVEIRLLNTVLLFSKTVYWEMQDQKFNLAKSQFLKIWFFDHFWANYNYGNAKTSIRGCTSAQIKTLRPYFSIFSITVVRICLRKQHSKLFTTMLSTPSIEPVNIWFDPAATWAYATTSYFHSEISWPLVYILMSMPKFSGKAIAKAHFMTLPTSFKGP